MTELLALLQDKIIELILGASGLFVWWKDRSKIKTELDRLKLENESLKLENETKKADKDVKVIDLYQEALDDLKKRFDERVDELKKRYDERVAEIQKRSDERYIEMQKQYDHKLSLVETEVKSLRTNLELWKNKYRNLKEEFENYKTGDN